MKWKKRKCEACGEEMTPITNLSYGVWPNQTVCSGICSENAYYRRAFSGKQKKENGERK